MRLHLIVFVCLNLLLAPVLVAADEHDQLKVGVQPDGRIVVPTNQILSPAGKQITFPGRPVDLAFVDGQTLVVKNMKNLVFLDTKTGKIVQTLPAPVGLSAVGLLVHRGIVYATDSADHVRVAERQDDGTYKWIDPIALKKPKQGVAYGTGLAKLSETEILVAANRSNTVQRVHLPTGKVLEEIAVGVAPFAIVLVPPNRIYVSNWGGDMPRDGDPRAFSSGTEVRIDPRTSIANHGSVSVLMRTGASWKQVKSIEVGLHPCGMVLSPDHRFLFVANACSDTVSVIDTTRDTVIETISCRPETRLPFGSGTNALAINAAGTMLYAANGSNNCIAVVQLGAKCSPAAAAPPASRVIGQIPTGWYPGAVLLTPDQQTLCVANIKGHGSVSQPRPVEKGKNSHDHLGSISLIPLPDAEQLAKYTKTVNDNNRLTYSLAGLEKPRPDAKPRAIPQRHGEPSLIKHVIYVIKENRTYDQVFGDIKEGKGDANLVLFGEEVTPNCHALARQFTLFDNFYCSGVLSADGHQWCNEAYVTDYLERMFGKFARSYPYEGSDPLAFAPTGFLWDNALLHKKTFRNYGEFVKTKYTPAAQWSDVYADWKNGTRKIKIEATPNIESLKPYTHPGYPGFPLTTPDVYRAKLFLEDLREYERKGEFPNLTYVFLPCDHTSGTNPGMPTPKAMVADNDLALGQIVEAVSKSKFWPHTCIFVVEDDPQNGFDHIDAHRTVALVISPYTKRKYVDSTCYNQTSMVKTIELILGLPPMNQMDLSATAMRACFTDKADLTPYKCLPNQIPLDQVNPPKKALKGAALFWAEKSMQLDLSEADRADEDTLNRILWHAVRGYNTPYPERFAGRRDED